MQFATNWLVDIAHETGSQLTKDNANKILDNLEKITIHTML